MNLEKDSGKGTEYKSYLIDLNFTIKVIRL